MCYLISTMCYLMCIKCYCELLVSPGCGVVGGRPVVGSEGLALVLQGSPSSPGSTAFRHDDGGAKVLSDSHLQNQGTDYKSESSESPVSVAPYPLSHSAQRQRRLCFTSNLRRARFNTPCSSQPQGGANGNITTAPHGPPEPSSAPCGQQRQGEPAAGGGNQFF